MKELKIYIKILIFPLVALVLFSCATKPSDRYSCITFEPWMSSIKTLAGDADLNRMVSTHRKRKRLAQLISPAFNDEVFKVSFGKTFRELSKKESEGIRQSMIKCHYIPWVFEISVPFTSDDFSKNRKAMWLGYIEDANKIPFDTIVEKRKNEADTKKLAAKYDAENRRKAQALARKRNQESNEKFITILKGAAVVLGGAMLYDALSDKNKTKYTEYGECAPALRKRLVSCRTSVGECNMIGCANKVDCDKGWSGRSCQRRIESILLPKNYYYCDSNNSFNYDSNKDIVIKKICGTK